MSSATPGGGRRNKRGPPSVPANPSAESQIPQGQHANINVPEEIMLVKECWYNDKHDGFIYQGLPPRGVGGNISRIWAPKQPDEFLPLSLVSRGRVFHDASRNFHKKSFYTGMDSFSISPVFLRADPPTKKGRNQDMSNSLRSGNFKIAGGQKKPVQIVPTLDLLRHKALSTLKAHCAGMQMNKTGYQRMDRPMIRKIELFQEDQSERFHSGRPFQAYFNDSSLPIDYAAIEDTNPDSWAYFRMMMPKVGGKQVPKQLGEAVFSFLTKHGEDLVSLNLAISMCIVWAHYVADPNHGAELAAYKGHDRNQRLLKPVRVPSLASFVLYSTHYFRLHEYLRLSAYIHIFRYVHEMYTRDRKLAGHFIIKKDEIDEELVKTLVSGMALQESDWVEIVPSSWAGSRLPMPGSHGPRAPQSEETTAALLLDDIYTLGFPDYTNEASFRFPPGHQWHNVTWVRRYVHVHQDWAPHHVCSVAASRYLHDERDPDEPSGRVLYISGTPYLPGGALVPAHEDLHIHQLWTAPKTKVRRAWKDCVEVEHANGPRNDAQPNPNVNRPEDRENSGNLIEQRGAEGGGAEGAQPGVPVLRQGEGDRDQAAAQNDSNPAIDNAREVHLIRDSVEEQELGDLNILPRPAHQAVAVEGAISDKDRRILRRLIKEDLADDKHIHPLSRIFRYIDVDNASLSKKTVIDHIDMGLKPLNEELEKINEYGRGGKREENGFVEQVLKPCYELLGLKWPGTLFVAIDELGKLDQSLVSAIIKLQAIYESAPVNLVQLGHATEKLQCSKSFLYIWRFCLLQDRLKGIDFASQEREKWWTKVFGKPYADE